ncbi:sensor histidine kinase [Desulfonatronum thiosulfatophilum]|uniref:sensor histidine kinase n=1 Tax=Desulfonatronum thiosulfatophilum TaxID=617002 RepID=UPI0013794B9B|nr:ATP-binding protein [Desulfonatronum thiosulfatophilum]
MPEIAQHDHIRQLYPDGSGKMHEEILNNIWDLYLNNAQGGSVVLSDLALRDISDAGRSVLHGDFATPPRDRVVEPGAVRGERDLYSLLNAISDTLLLISPKFELLWSNHVGVHGFNSKAAKGVLEYCGKMLREGAVSSNGCLVQRCFDANEKVIETVTHDGFVLEIKAFPISNGELTGSVLLWVSDVTEKMTLEAERIQAGNLAAVGEWAAGVAHEINNPITGIINYGQILINESASNSLEKDLGERIVKEGERVSRIVNNLLSYARNRQKEKHPVQISSILEETIFLTQTKIRRDGISLKVDLLDDLPEVEVNFQEIQQVFINIITNARHALNEKYDCRHDNKRLEIRAEQIRVDDRTHVRIEFLDHGVGIAPENLDRITKPFFTTKPSGKGTGLGLSITTKIIADHGGRLCFESTEGEYTRTIIDLPSHVA